MSHDDTEKKIALSTGDRYSNPPTPEEIESHTAWATNPNTWRHSAIRLFRGSLILFAQACRDTSIHGRLEEHRHLPFLMQEWTAAMLGAFALENMFKCIIVQQEPDNIVDSAGNIKREILVHDIRKLSARAGVSAKTHAERQVLENGNYVIATIGRYGIEGHARDARRSAQINSVETCNAISSLFFRAEETYLRTHWNWLANKPQSIEDFVSEKIRILRRDLHVHGTHGFSVAPPGVVAWSRADAMHDECDALYAKIKSVTATASKEEAMATVHQLMGRFDDYTLEVSREAQSLIDDALTRKLSGHSWVETDSIPNSYAPASPGVVEECVKCHVKRVKWPDGRMQFLDPPAACREAPPENAQTR